MKDASVKRWSRFHTIVFKATRGYLGDRLVNNDMCLLTTTGRRTGRPHTVPLLYLREDDRLVVIASYGGRDNSPDWYLNLESNPDVVVQEPHATPRRARAKVAGQEERELWWPRIVDAYHGYGAYQSRTDRLIPVVFIDPL